MYAHATRSIIGARDHQEDASAISLISPAVGPSGGGQQQASGELLAVLADGMGGHVGGSLASNTACNRFIDAFGETVTGETYRARLKRALHESNSAIADQVRRERSLMGMGCTLIGACLGETGLRWVSVGDSLLLLFRDGELKRLNADHSMAPLIDDMVERGELTVQEGANHPQRHFLRSALTGSPIELIDVNERLHPLLPDDWIVLASDGLETLDQSDVTAILHDTCMASADVVADALIDAVDRVGHPYQDNTTIVVARPRFSQPV